MTYDPIASTTLTSSASSVTFSSIPTDGTYRDLILVCNYQITANGNPIIRFNSDSGSNYSWVHANGTGSATASSASADTQINPMPQGTTIANQRIMTVLQVLDYAQTNKHKSCLVRHDDPTTRGTLMMAARYATTTAVSSITFLNATFASGSTFSLYGVAA